MSSRDHDQVEQSRTLTPAPASCRLCCAGTEDIEKRSNIEEGLAEHASIKLQDVPGSAPAIPPTDPRPRKRPKDWICNFGGRKLAYASDATAQAIVREWFPTQEATVKASMPGWAGMASYTVLVADEKLHMKVMIPEAVEGVRPALPSPKQCETVDKEGRRAAWAGSVGLGPQVVGRDVPRGAYACQYIDEIAPSVAESRGKYLLPYLRTLSALHFAPTDAVPSRTGGTNWLFGIDSTKCLTKADKPRPLSFQRDLLRLEAGLVSFLAKTQFLKTAVHDDLKLDHSLVTQSNVLLIDWANLHLDDPMTDLGCFFAMADVPTRSFATMLKLYDAHNSPSGTAAVDPSRLARLEANAALLRLKNVTFYDQWQGTRAKSEYLYNVLRDDLDYLEASTLRGIDF